VHVLIATDADWVIDEVRSALEGPDTTFIVCRDGRSVVPAVRQKTPDLAVLDLQVGSMGGMAITMALRLDESGGLLPHVPVLMLLDRVADVHLARRSGAEAWIIKPLDPLRLRAAAKQALEPRVDASVEFDEDEVAEETPEGEPAATG
jgi:DNA-binding response OmpR family regulator